MALVSSLQILYFALERKTDLSQSFYVSAQIQFRLKAKHIFNIFEVADQNPLEKTFHPFLPVIFG